MGQKSTQKVSVKAGVVESKLKSWFDPHNNSYNTFF